MSIGSFGLENGDAVMCLCRPVFCVSFDSPSGLYKKLSKGSKLGLYGPSPAISRKERVSTLAQA